MKKMLIYGALQETPKNATKPIAAGRLKGFTDINPMYRIKKLTELFGPCGIGWVYEVTHRELQEGANGEKKAFVQIALRYANPETGEWSAPVYGDGGSSFISAERNGLYTDDECYKKAITDAIGSACKMLGMSADIYWSEDRTKYTTTEEKVAAPAPEAKAPETRPAEEHPAYSLLIERCQEFATAHNTTVDKTLKALQKAIGALLTYDTVENYGKTIAAKIKEDKEKIA